MVATEHSFLLGTNQERTTLMSSKPLFFGIAGAMGCFAGALLGEGWLLATRDDKPPAPQITPKSVCLLIDCSGSMVHGPLDEAKAAAQTFVDKQNFSVDRLAVLSFADTAGSACPMSKYPAQLKSRIGGLTADGSTNMAEGLKLAWETLQGESGQRWILLFSDGAPDSRSEARSQAQRVLHEGTQIVAIATGGADEDFLGELAGDPQRVLWAASGEFERTFEQAREIIKGGVFIESERGVTGLMGMARVAGWTAVVGIGLCLALIVAQNRYLFRPIFQFREMLRGVGGSFLAGLVAGGTSQVLYVVIGAGPAARTTPWLLCGSLLGLVLLLTFRRSAEIRLLVAAAALGVVAGGGGVLIQMWLAPYAWSYTDTSFLWLAWWSAASVVAAAAWQLRHHQEVKGPAMRRAFVGLAFAGAFLLAGEFVRPHVDVISDAVTRSIGWILLGSLLGWSMSFFVPNLGVKRGIIGGLIGGALGAAGFLGLMVTVGDLSGRLIGAAVLGLCIGLMIAIVEETFRRVWLEIIYGPRESRTVSLGPEPVTIGSDGVECTVYAPQAPSIALRYHTEQSRIICEDVAQNRTQDVQPGDRRRAGNVEVCVCDGGIPAATDSSSTTSADPPAAAPPIGAGHASDSPVSPEPTTPSGTASMATGLWRLCVITGTSAGKQFDLPGGQYTLGSAQGSRICIPHPTIAPLHIRLDVGSESIDVTDCSDGHGVRVNGELCQYPRIRNGDRVMLGEFEVQFLQV